MRLMIGYASRYGSTTSIARRIAGTLKAHGHRVEVREMGPEATTEDYDALVLGSAIHRGAWLPETAGFLRRLDPPSDRPVWLFSVGAAGRTGGRLDRAADEPVRMPGCPVDLHPVDRHRFPGVLEPGHFSLVGRWVYRWMGGKYGDFRDWEDVEAWAELIALRLTEVSSDA
ncbi:flavodoxin domain-containing protein [Streptomyces sparsus]